MIGTSLSVTTLYVAGRSYGVQPAADAAVGTSISVPMTAAADSVAARRVRDIWRGLPRLAAIRGEKHQRTTLVTLQSKMEATVPTKLPRGPHGLTREQVEADQRGRLIGAMSMIVAEKGYGDTAVADVVARAGVSRRTFYEQFANKEDCFLAAYDVGARIVIGRIDDALAAAADDVDWRGRVSIALRSFAETLAGQPQLAALEWRAEAWAVVRSAIRQFRRERGCRDQPPESGPFWARSLP